MPSPVFLASLRLCVRLFFQPIDDTGYAVLDERSIEIDQQAQSFVGQPQMRPCSREGMWGTTLKRLTAITWAPLQSSAENPESGGVPEVMEEVVETIWRPNRRRASLLFTPRSPASD